MSSLRTSEAASLRASRFTDRFLVFLFLFVLCLSLYVFIRDQTKNKKIAELTDTEAVTLGDVVVTPLGPKIEISKEDDPKGKSKVIRARSTTDNNFYLVSAELPDKVQAANFLAELHRRSQTLLQALEEMMDGGQRVVSDDNVDLSLNFKRLVKKHFKKETGFAEYHNPKDRTVGANSAKGELVEICIRSKSNPAAWNSMNTAFRVHVHELAHSADNEFREDGDHGPEFNRIMNRLLQIAENLGLYNCAEYKRSGRAFCGLTLTEEDSFCS
jgi:hypothetical protein